VTATATSLHDHLVRLGACKPAIEWASGKTIEQAWAECERGDWLLWLAISAGVDRRRVVLAACACARLSLPHVPAGEMRPLKAIETTEAWARGDAGVTLSDVAAAASAADAAASAADAAFAAGAAGAATTHRQCADIVHSHITAADIRAGLEANP
jgi:hypothetical protein